MSIPEGATHKMNGTFYKLLEQSGEDLRLERIKVQVWDGVQWHEVFLNDNAPLVEIETEPYKPVVGEWCEVESDVRNVWKKAMYIGIDSIGSHVFDVEKRQLWRLGSIDILVRPIKNGREQFIEKVTNAVCSASIEQLDVKGNVKRIAGILYDAQFIGPDDE